MTNWQSLITNPVHAYLKVSTPATINITWTKMNGDVQCGARGWSLNATDPLNGRATIMSGWYSQNNILLQDIWESPNKGITWETVQDPAPAVPNHPFGPDRPGIAFLPTGVVMSSHPITTYWPTYYVEVSRSDGTNYGAPCLVSYAGGSSWPKYGAMQSIITLIDGSIVILGDVYKYRASYNDYYTGYIHRSTDGGATWSVLVYPAYGARSNLKHAVLSTGEILVAGGQVQWFDNGTKTDYTAATKSVYLSEPTATTWTYKGEGPWALGHDCWAVALQNDIVILFCAEKKIWFTSNKGLTWNQLPAGPWPSTISDPWGSYGPPKFTATVLPDNSIIVTGGVTQMLPTRIFIGECWRGVVTYG